MDEATTQDIALWGRRDALYGLKSGEFQDLPRPVKSKLLRMIARIAEKSYRRGFQHGVVMARDGRQIVDPEKFRFRCSLDKSPFTDGPGGHTAVQRLMMENKLEQVGFDEPYRKLLGKELWGGYVRARDRHCLDPASICTGRRMGAQ